MQWKFLCLDHSEARPLDVTLKGSAAEAMARAAALEWKSENSGLVFAATDGPPEDFAPPAGWQVRDIGPVPFGWGEINDPLGPGPAHGTPQSSCQYHLSRRGPPLCLRIHGRGGEITQIIVTQGRSKTFYDGNPRWAQ